MIETTEEAHVEVDAAWAYWIDPATMRMARVRGSVPVDVVVLVKSSESLESGISFVATKYMVARSDGLRSISKKEAIAVLGRQMIGYMKNNMCWPPDCELSRIFKNGDAEVRYHPSQYDSFTIRITDAMVGENTEMFLESLGPAKKAVDDTLLQWMIEPARSGRARCKTCGHLIEKGQLRVGEPYLYEEHLAYSWHHLKCISHILRHLELKRINGIEALSHDEKMEFESIVRAINTGPS